MLIHLQRQTKARPDLAETTTTATHARAQATLHVLVVEDDALIALDIEQMLVELGPVRVTLAHDLTMGLEALDAGCPDLAILDLDLGANDSLPIAARLATLGKPYLFLTGYQAAEMGRLRDAHAPAHSDADVLEKPFSIDVLAQMVRRHLPPL